ncbi:hypothetical protein LSH36_863g00029 [Paralvinella palmiformis]|uniref:Methionine aminopeptidase n=1 Tax=Paralvinella palmiformis TaxID=53620 RepID=A0AAD9IZ33_9ANNE|nr:hypothetical protein LSH36_863g00029 [Paralvinella palmiformis]
MIFRRLEEEHYLSSPGQQSAQSSPPVMLLYSLPRCFGQRGLLLGVRNLVSVCSCQHHHIVSPGNVSPARLVPDTIQRPPYISRPLIRVLRFRKRQPEIKSAEQIKGMRDSCRLARDILEAAGQFAKEGITTDAIDEFVHEMAISHNAYPSPLNYKGFPKSVCTSVNNVGCHGIPDDRPLEAGDIINIDVTVYLNGYHGDTSSTFLIGDVDEEGQKLVSAARQCRDLAIQICGPGQPLFNIGDNISKVASSLGYQVVPDFCGHGIGDYFHGPPTIVHVVNNVSGKMQEGMTFTIEPVISEGGVEFTVLDDGWTSISKDNSRSAQFEHTILITGNGAEILT